jgi:hypothetical protein
MVHGDPWVAVDGPAVPSGIEELDLMFRADGSITADFTPHFDAEISTSSIQGDDLTVDNNRTHSYNDVYTQVEDSFEYTSLYTYSIHPKESLLTLCSEPEIHDLPRHDGQVTLHQWVILSLAMIY